MKIITRTERCTRTIEELEREFDERVIAPFVTADDFVDMTTPETFESLYAQLSPELQLAVRRRAESNFDNFDAVIADLRSRGAYADGWIALRDWAKRQPWFPKGS
jgi:hypothetical protein